MALIQNSYETLDSVGAKTPVDYGTENDDDGDDDDDQHLPPWLVQEKLQHSRRLFQRYFFCLCFAHFSGLVILVFIRSILDTLKKTGKSKDLVAIFYRYFHTLLHVKKWYEGRIWDKKDDAYISLKTVKKMHQNVSNVQNQGRLTNKDLMAISKRDMTLTQFAFVAITVLHPEKVGFSNQPKDLESLIHFWAVIGYMLGIEDDYNLCLGDYPTVRQRCQILFERKFRQPLIDFDQESANMAEQIVTSVNQLVYALKFKPHFRMIFEILDDQTPPPPQILEMKKSESYYYHQMKFFMQTLYHCWLVAFILNHLLRFSIYLCQFRLVSKQIEHNLKKQN